MKEYQYKILFAEDLSSAIKESTFFDGADNVYLSAIENVRKNGISEYDTFAIACFDQNVLIGLCGIEYHPNSFEEASIVYYLVHQNYRKQGIAKRLLATTILFEKKFHPTTTIQTNISIYNIASRNTISNLGFYRLGTKYYLEEIPKNQDKYPVYKQIENTYAQIKKQK